MSKGPQIKPEQKQKIYDLYDSGMTVYLHIAKEVGVSDSTVGKIIKSRNAATSKICPNCKRESGREARFCFFCGNDIRSREELLLLRVQSLRGMIVHLPENARADFDATTREIMGYLKEKGA
jgi:predicted RNA-binding Zn-ribbon protein involved in translation (DUF1610 family)